MNEGERIARLEVEVEDASRERQDLKERINGQAGDLKVIRSDVHEIKENISGHMGFIRGIVFVFTAVGSAIGAIGIYLWNKIHGN